MATYARDAGGECQAARGAIYTAGYEGVSLDGFLLTASAAISTACVRLSCLCTLQWFRVVARFC